MPESPMRPAETPAPEKPATPVAPTGDDAPNALLMRGIPPLRRPLATLLTTVERLRASITVAGTAAGPGAIAGQMHESALAVKKMIDALADAAALEAGGLRLAPAAIDLQAILRAAVTRAAPAAQARGLTLTTVIAPEAGALWWADAGRLAAVLDTLIDDALATLPAGLVTVEAIRVGPAADPTLIGITITDDGLGAPLPNLPRLSEVFRTAEDAWLCRRLTRDLAVALARHRIEAMGGRIGAVRRPGIGRRVWVQVPLSRAAARDQTTGAGGRRSGAGA